jgi:hypothetical protein
VLEQTIGRSIFKPKERELAAAVELGDDSRREPAEPAASVVEKNRASHARNGTSLQNAEWQSIRPAIAPQNVFKEVVLWRTCQEAAPRRP